jgi:predicted transglutaminase-like cysteine proteinase
MAQLVRQFKTDTGIRQLAQELTRSLASHDAAGEVLTLQHFVRDRIRYVKDVHEVETVQTPVYTLQMASGDCDDKAVLLNTLLASIGYATFFLAMGIDGAAFSHVVAGVKLGNRNIPLETIVDGREPGWLPPNAGPFLPWNI